MLLALELKTIVDPNTAPGAVFWALVCLLGAVVVSWALGRILRRTTWAMGKLGRKVDQTVVSYAGRIKTILVFFCAALVYASLIPSLRSLLGTLLASAGITALVVGFAAKSTLSNLMSGLSLAIYRPIRIGDKVTIENEYGTIEDITLRHTIVRTWEEKRLVIPNEKLDQMPLINYSLVNPRTRLRLDFGVSYDTDIDLARRLVLDEIKKCPQVMGGEAPDPPTVYVTGMGDFAIGLRALVWVADMDSYWLAKWALIEAVKKRFDAEGVEIPFPYRTLVYKKDLPPPRSGEPAAPSQSQKPGETP